MGGGGGGFVVLRESYRRVVYRESVGENVGKDEGRLLFEGV